MTGERNARVALGYLKKEETVLTSIKEALESQLMRLQIDEMNLRVAYQSLKSKKETETRIGIEIKHEPEIKTESVSPQQKKNSEIEILELKPFTLGPISETKRNVEELPELVLEPCHLTPFSDSETDVDEISDLLLEPFYPDSEELSLDNSEDCLT